MKQKIKRLKNESSAVGGEVEGVWRLESALRVGGPEMSD